SPIIPMSALSFIIPFLPAVSRLESSAACPQPECRIRYEENLFSIRQFIETVHKVFVPRCHAVEGRIAEPCVFDFAPCEMAGTIGNGEATLRRSVNQMSCCAEIPPHVFVCASQFQDPRGPGVTESSDQRVYGLVFTETSNSRRKDHQ